MTLSAAADAVDVSPPQAICGIERSAKGIRWLPRLQGMAQERQAAAIAQQYGVAHTVARVLAARGVTTETVTDFLSPTLKSSLPDPSHLQDMEKAVARLYKAIIENETIAVFGDYDVDGGTSSALLKRYFAAFGKDIIIYIPERMSEGYGPNRKAFETLHGQGVNLIITVDCGSVAFEPIARANKLGMEVIVVDHHISEAALPEAHAVINPNRLDQESDYGHLAAVGVTFLLLIALNRHLREQEYFSNDMRESDLMQWLDLVALGTVCDVVPLKTVNRALVTQGLKVMAKRHNPGIAALYDVAGINEAPNAYHAGFVIGPRINAGGRVGQSSLGSELLACDDPLRCAGLAKQLDQFNAERQAIEAQVLEDAMAQAEPYADDSVIIVASEGWHEGVIGIVAGRLKDQFHKPVAVISLRDGIGKASARSVSGADIGAAVTSARMEGLLIAGGGHSMAAGFSVEEHKIEMLREYLSTRLGSAVDDYFAGRSLKIDAVIQARAATLDLVNALEQVGPFGMGNPGVNLVLPDQRIVHSTILKEQHIKLITTDDSGAKVTAMAFRAVGTAVGDMLLSANNRSIHLAGSLKRNRWNGNETAQFIIEDCATD